MEFPVVTEHFIDLQFLYDLPIYASWFSISSIVVIFINMTHAVNLDKYLNLLSKYLPTLIAYKSVPAERRIINF